MELLLLQNYFQIETHIEYICDNKLLSSCLIALAFVTAFPRVNALPLRMYFINIDV